MDRLDLNTDDIQRTSSIMNYDDDLSDYEKEYDHMAGYVESDSDDYEDLRQCRAMDSDDGHDEGVDAGNIRMDASSDADGGCLANESIDVIEEDDHENRLTDYERLLEQSLLRCREKLPSSSSSSRAAAAAVTCTSNMALEGDDAPATKYYDDVYFDSDGDDDGNGHSNDIDGDISMKETDEQCSFVDKRNVSDSRSYKSLKACRSKRSLRAVQDDSSLLYDPTADDDDERWMLLQRRAHLPASMRARIEVKERADAAKETAQDAETTIDSASTSIAPVEAEGAAISVESPGVEVEEGHTNCVHESSGIEHANETVKPFLSDACLSCPACMTTICVDCQRHEIYQGQYRAMFVYNVRVVPDEVLRYPAPKPPTHHKMNHFDNLAAIPSSTSSSELDEVFHPVRCDTCSTEVGVYDCDEVYHFFNVLSFATKNSSY